MRSDTFRPYPFAPPARARGCWTCTNFQGRLYCGHVLCERDGSRHVMGVPAMGCASWMRAIGSDHE